MFWTITITLLVVLLAVAWAMDRRAKQRHQLAAISQTESYRNGPDMMNKSYTSGTNPNTVGGAGAIGDGFGS